MFTTRFNTKQIEEGKFRLIHDLYYPKGDSVNSAIPTEYTSVSYENIETVIHLVQQHGHNCLMAKSDKLYQINWSWKLCWFVFFLHVSVACFFYRNVHISVCAYSFG
jgi:hypothetical protein